MSDVLLSLGSNPNARRIFKQLGIPLDLPQPLRRARSPRAAMELRDRNLVVSMRKDSAAADCVAQALCRGGAHILFAGHSRDDIPARFYELGEAFARPTGLVSPATLRDLKKQDGAVFDATWIRTAADLRALYEFFHPLARSFSRCAHIVVLGSTLEGDEPAESAAAQAALDGFVRALSKELGGDGTTVNLLWIEPGAEELAEGPLTFLLSDRCAFVTGQPLTATSLAVQEHHGHGHDHGHDHDHDPENDDDGAYVLELPRPGVGALAGEIALVTGAGRGIGAATAKALAGEGARVVCLDRPEDDALVSAVARQIGGEVLLVDVSAPDAPQQIVKALEELGGVDIVVHNAGVTRDKKLANMKPEAWDLAVDINLAAVMRINTALLDGCMHEQGRIVLLSSVAGIAGNLGQTNYAASKAGLLGYCDALASEVAHSGITVNAIAPGFIETRLTAAIPVMIREAGRRLSSLGQGGLPEDVAEAITFLALPSSRGISANVLRVCGGALIGA